MSEETRQPQPEAAKETELTEKELDQASGGIIAILIGAKAPAKDATLNPSQAQSTLSGKYEDGLIDLD